MSELTRCNYCSLQGVKQRAKEKNLKVTVLTDGWGGSLGGLSVYVHPKEIKIPKLSIKEREKYFSRWLMELSDRCAC